MLKKIFTYLFCPEDLVVKPLLDQIHAQLSYLRAKLDDLEQNTKNLKQHWDLTLDKVYTELDVLEGMIRDDRERPEDDC